MSIKVYFLILVISFEIFSLSSAKRARPRGAREYSEELPETRRVNITGILKHHHKPKVESTVNNTAKHKEAIEFPQSRVGIIGVHLPDKVEFPETRVTNSNKHSNTTRTSHSRNKHNHKRVTRQTEDIEDPSCADCLDEKYLKHYYARGCKPIQQEIQCNKPCPKYFECPEKQKNPSIQGCEYKGKIYNVSDTISSEDGCLHCLCNNISKPRIICAVSECFGDWRPMNRSCYKVYEEGKCCSNHQCLTDQQLKEVKTCFYDGKYYKLGEKIYPKEDNCLTCICGEKWNQSDPLNSEACKRNQCDFELNSKWMDREECVPIYHENACCPVDYHCPPPKTPKCVFDGKQYEIGEKLDTKNDCIDCTCRVPPDFTCLRRKCDPKPSDADCTPVYQAEKCCPTYNCTVNAKEAAGAQNEIVSDVEVPVLGNPKSLSKPCPPFIPEGLACAGTNCTTIIDSNGCQACSCEIPCPQLECNDPCHVFAVTPGECPRCSCP